jgi:hypothetical protein
MAESAKITLAEIFDRIPIDGSNIKEDDGDNIYENIEGVPSGSFEERASELSAKIKTVPPVSSLPKAEKTSAEPVKGIPAEGNKPADLPVVNDSPNDVTEAKPPTPKVEDVIVSAITESTPNVEAASVKSDVVIAVEAPLQSHKKATSKGEKKAAVTVKIDDEDVDRSSKAEEAPVSQTEVSDADESDVVNSTPDAVENEDVFDPEAWHFVSPHPWFNEMYLLKQRAISYLLPGGKLPFEEYHQELLGATVQTSVTSYDLSELYERMQEVQSQRNRVLEIKLKAEHQYFPWKRHIEMFRGMAAQKEKAKGAQVDGVAYPHLWDWEKYWTNLEALQKKAEGVMRNLEGAYETLSRQVTIVLQANEASKDGSRFQPIHEKIEKYVTGSKETESIEKSEESRGSRNNLENFDTLDSSHKPEWQVPKKDKPSNLGGWEIVK